MSYWQEVKDMLLKDIDLAIDGMKQSAAGAFEKGGAGMSLTGVNAILFVEHRNLQELLADMGDRTRELYKEKKDIYSDPVISELNEKIALLETECKLLDEIIRIRSISGK